MKYRRLGKTGLEVSVVGLGSWQFGGEWGQAFSPEAVQAIVGRARDAGINLIDTAECYGDHLSESLIGQAIQGERASWIVATKFGHRFHGHLERTDRWSPEEVVAQLEASLRALRTDYVDIYQFHSGSDAVFDSDALWTTLDKQVRAGKIRFLGNSVADNRSAYQTSRSSEVGVSVIQVVYNRLDRGPEQAIFEAARAQDLGVLAREPMANGLLSGHYPPGASFSNPRDWRSAAWPEEVLRGKLLEVDRVRQQELPAGASLPAWALAWVLRQPAVAAVIPGCKSPEQLSANARAADMASEA